MSVLPQRGNNLATVLIPKRVFSIQYSVFFAIVTLSMVTNCKKLFYEGVS